MAHLDVEQLCLGLQFCKGLCPSFIIYIASHQQGCLQCTQLCTKPLQDWTLIVQLHEMVRRYRSICSNLNKVFHHHPLFNMGVGAPATPALAAWPGTGWLKVACMVGGAQGRLHHAEELLWPQLRL